MSESTFETVNRNIEAHTECITQIARVLREPSSLFERCVKLVFPFSAWKRNTPGTLARGRSILCFQFPRSLLQLSLVHGWPCKFGTSSFRWYLKNESWNKIVDTVQTEYRRTSEDKNSVGTIVRYFSCGMLYRMRGVSLPRVCFNLSVVAFTRYDCPIGNRLGRSAWDRPNSLREFLFRK